MNYSLCFSLMETFFCSFFLLENYIIIFRVQQYFGRELNFYLHVTWKVVFFFLSKLDYFSQQHFPHWNQIWWPRISPPIVDLFFSFHEQDHSLKEQQCLYICGPSSITIKRWETILLTFHIIQEFSPRQNTGTWNTLSVAQRSQCIIIWIEKAKFLRGVVKTVWVPPGFPSARVIFILKILDIK